MTIADREAPHAPSRGCYQAGCRTKGCVRANRIYDTQIRIDRLNNRRRVTNATQTRVHLNRLIAADWHIREIYRVTGVARSAIDRILEGQQEVRTSTALAILSTPIGPPPGRSQGVDATGSVRRTRALMHMGHTGLTIARHADLGDDKVNRIAAGRFTVVSPDTAAAIARAYRALIVIPGRSARAQRHARLNGWHGPLAWGEDIDNPDAQPETEHRESRAGASSRPKVYADPARVAQLTAAGKSAAQIAQELGCHQRTVIRARRRAEMAVAA